MLPVPSSSGGQGAAVLLATEEEASEGELRRGRKYELNFIRHKCHTCSRDFTCGRHPQQMGCGRMQCPDCETGVKPFMENAEEFALVVECIDCPRIRLVIFQGDKIVNYIGGWERITPFGYRCLDCEIARNELPKVHIAGA